MPPISIPAFEGTYHGFALAASYEPEQADVHLVIHYDGVPVLDVRITAADAEHLITPILNALAPLARELGAEFAAWFKKVAAEIRPSAVEPVIVGALRIPARLIGRIERPNKSRQTTVKDPKPAAPAGHGPAASAKLVLDGAAALPETTPGIVPATVSDKIDALAAGKAVDP